SAFGTTFVTKLSGDARSLIYSTYYGGSYEEIPSAGVLLDSSGNAYVAGDTASNDLPVLHALQPNHAAGFDWFVGKISPSGVLIFSTYLGGSGFDVCDGEALAHDGSL